MSTMEPDEGTGTDAPRWDKTEAANPPSETDAPRWERAEAADTDTDDGDGGDDDDEADDSTGS